MKKKVIFFGGSGFLGKYFCENIIKNNHDLTIVDIVKPKIKGKYNFIKADINLIKSFEKYIKTGSYVFNFAGWTDIETSNQNPIKTQQSNIIGNSNILEVCSKVKIKKYIFASTLYVFSEYGGFYKSSKQCSEILIKEYSKLYNINYSILRFGSLYGPGAKDGNAIYDLIKMAYNNKKIVYWGKGDEMRQYIHARDAAKICELIIKNKINDKFLLLTGTEDFRITDVIKTITEMVKFPVKVTYKLNKKSFTHYKNSPFTIPSNFEFKPSFSEKITFDKFTDLRQGIYECCVDFQKSKIK